MLQIKLQKSNIIWILALIFGLIILSKLFIIQPYYSYKNKSIESNYETIKGRWRTVENFLNNENNLLEKCELHIGTLSSNSVSYTPPNQENFKFSKEGVIVDVKGNEFLVGEYRIDGTYNVEFVLNIEQFDLNSKVNSIRVNNHEYERIQ